jgi:hypothetical protein
LFFLNRIDTIGQGMVCRDSLFHSYGMAYHFLKKPDTAAFYLNHVSQASPCYAESAFYGSLNNIYADQTDAARKNILRLNVDTSRILNQQKNLQLCGTYLLKRSLKAADSVAAYFDYGNYFYSEEESVLTEISKRLKKQNKKTPFKAAMLSVVVPGLGKYYAGRRGQAVATFFGTVILGLIAGENLYRGGPRSPQFFVTGGIFTVFYFGNIVGSAYSVRIVKRQNKKMTDYEIKSCIHRPLVRIFN